MRGLWPGNLFINPICDGVFGHRQAAIQPHVVNHGFPMSQAERIIWPSLEAASARGTACGIDAVPDCARGMERTTSR